MSGTPDAHISPTKCGEIKATWKSLHKRMTAEEMEANEESWLMQTCMNAYHYKRQLGELWVLYLCGNYDRPFNPQLVVYSLEWTVEEQEKIWRELLEHYEKANPEKGSGKWQPEKSIQSGTLDKPIKWPRR